MAINGLIYGSPAPNPGPSLGNSGSQSRTVSTGTNFGSSSYFSSNSTVSSLNGFADSVFTWGKNTGISIRNSVKGSIDTVSNRANDLWLWTKNKGNAAYTGVKGAVGSSLGYLSDRGRELERGSDIILDNFASVGAWYDSFRTDVNSSSNAKLVNFLDGGDAALEEAARLDLRAMAQQYGPMNGSLENTEAYFANYSPSKFAPGPVLKTFGYLGSTIDAATGILNVASAVNQDRLAGDSSYTRSFKASMKSAGQISAGFVAGAAASVGTAAAAGALGFGAAAVAPVLLVGAAGAGAAYAGGWAYGKLADWLSGD